MEPTSSEYSDNSEENQKEQRTLYLENYSLGAQRKSSLTEPTESGVDENFSYYLDMMHLLSGKDLLVLSSSNHYYYEPEDMKDVRTLVHIKPLNQVSQIKEFFNSIFTIIPRKSYFIGCFSDSKNQNWFMSDSDESSVKSSGQFDPEEHGISSRNPFLNLVYNILDVRTNRYLTKKSVSLLLGSAGWKVLDMTDIKGVTYFCAQKSLSD